MNKEIRNIALNKNLNAEEKKLYLTRIHRELDTAFRAVDEPFIYCPDCDDFYFNKDGKCPKCDK